jgi:hypothetical protein
MFMTAIGALVGDETMPGLASEEIETVYQYEDAIPS